MIFFVLCVHIRKTLEFNIVLSFHMTHVIINQYKNNHKYYNTNKSDR